MLEYTPMMTQYLEIKENYKDCLLLFRLGDFYELFFEDAIKASLELDITLTKKACGKRNGEALKVDMCGVPFHSVEGHISKLISKGYKVAICEQDEDAKNSSEKIVKRKVVRVVTAGTILDTNMLEESRNNYIMCLFENKAGLSLAVSDVSTGEFLTMEISLKDKFKLIDEVAKYNPSEVICNEDFSLKDNIERIFNIKVYTFLDSYFNIDNAKITLLNHFNLNNLSCFEIEDKPFLISVSGALVAYLLDTQKNNLEHISTIKKYSTERFMNLDISSRRNLELTETIREKGKKGSLLWVLQKTKTPMGGRLLRKFIEQPLIEKSEIDKRLEAVQWIKDNNQAREELKEVLAKVKDIERIIGRISYKSANARDLIALKCSFEILTYLKSFLENSSGILFNELNKDFDILSDLYDLINDSIEEEPVFSVREGGIIKQGYDERVDHLRNIKSQGGNMLIQLETREKERTGIKNLKIKFNKVFGYYIEVTNSNLNLVPSDYIRKQTVATGERFITEELKKIEEDILGADEKIGDIEYEIFCKIRDEIAINIKRVQKTANYIAIIDVIASFAQVAIKNGYTRPNILEAEEDILKIKDGRHPVVELLGKEQFIPNDTFLDTDGNRLSIITGPNMAGKSTYMRQVAIIVLMAQIGSFVPAESADISIADRIFTRVGASDDLATGQSTFMVEMTEVANILNNATSKSLLILDEIGRGTSTFDGLSIAWAVLEYIVNKAKIGARTLFATHYHELTSLETKLSGVKNYYVEIKDTGNDIIFLRKIVRGVSGGSYGVHVAKIAGIPEHVIERANEILKILTKNEETTSSMTTFDYDLDNCNDEKDIKYTANVRKGMMFVDEIAKELKDMDINKVSPMSAWEMLFKLKSKIDKL